MKTRTKRTIRKKVALLVLAVSLSTVLLMGLAAALGLASIRGDTMANLAEINARTAADATAALRSQAQSELVTLVENKSSQADTSLNLILNQTRLVAMAAEEIYSNPEAYLAGVDPDDPPLDAYDFSCNYDESVHGGFSYHLRAPRAVLKNIVEDHHGTVLSADLDAGALTAEEKRELYLAGFLKTALGGIRNFDNGDGTYTGIGATYFCLASSGIDILADTLTMDMVEYDARGSEWYIEAANLGPGEVYWTDPLQDASGRGSSLICAMPVYVDGELIGVAGSGGDIDNIREMVQGTTIGESGYAMLVSRRRSGEVNVIASANPDPGSELGGSGNLMLTPNGALARALTAINRGGSGVTELPIDGESVYLAYHPLETADWSMVTVISLDDATITEPIEQLRGNIDAVTADTGEDYLCSINYGVYQGEAYVLDVLYTKEGMEFTEPAAAKLLFEGKVNAADIESNNGGRGFARAVERLLREQYHSTRCVIRPFYQSANKAARILSHSTWVMEHIYFPVNWKDRWPAYYDAMHRFQKEGHNLHDDAPDATTGIAETIGGGPVYSFD